METMSDIYRAQVLYTRKRVMEVTGLTADEISQMQFEKAYEWLEMIGCVGDMQTHMTSTKEFWTNFWKPEWHRIDVLFLQHYERWQYEGSAIREWHSYFHTNPKFTDGPVVQANYHQVIKELAKTR